MNESRIVAEVDDDEDHRMAIASLIRSWGWDVRTFSTPAEYLQSIYVPMTFCLVSDVRMPGMSGIEMHAQLRRLGFSPPTIFITAFPTDTLRSEILSAGGMALLEKPVDATAMAHWIQFAANQI